MIKSCLAFHNKKSYSTITLTKTLVSFWVFHGNHLATGSNSSEFFPCLCSSRIQIASSAVCFCIFIFITKRNTLPPSFPPKSATLCRRVWWNAMSVHIQKIHRCNILSAAKEWDPNAVPAAGPGLQGQARDGWCCPGCPWNCCTDTAQALLHPLLLCAWARADDLKKRTTTYYDIHHSISHISICTHPPWLHSHKGSNLSTSLIL